MMKRLFVFILFGCSGSFAQNSSFYPDIKVIESDERGMTLEFHPQFSENRRIAAKDNVFEIPQFKYGFSSLNNTPGREDIRIRNVTIAVPSYTGNTVSVIASDYETVNSFSLAPVPDVEAVDNIGASKITYQPDFISRNDYYPQQIAEVSAVGRIKGFLIGKISIAPYQYQSAASSLRRYTRIVVRIDFGTRNVDFDDSGNDDWAKATLLNYPIAKRWASIQRLKKNKATSSVLAAGTWIKMEVADEGMYKIDANYLRSVGIDPASLNSLTDVKIFGADGRNIPENPVTPRPQDLPQLAVEYVDKNLNSKFDNDDYVLFYGQGISGWNYDPVLKQFRHYTNPYTFSNYYFLSVGSSAPVRQMNVVAITSTSGGKLNQVPGKVFFDEDRFNFNQSGQLWVSPPMNGNESRVISTKLTGWIPGTRVTYRYHVYSRSNTDAVFVVEESGVQISSVVIDGKSDYDLNSPEFTYANDAMPEITVTPSLVDQRSNVKFVYSVNSSVASGFIDWLNIFYSQQLSAASDVLVFASPDTSGVVEYSATGFTTNLMEVYEVSDMNNVRKISHQMEQSLGSLSFKDSLSTGTIKKYWTGTPAKYLTPKSAIKIPNSDLHGSNGAEFIIITHNEFKNEALRLKTHKENLPGAKKISTVVVDIDTVFNEFGIGMPDPTAMRDFIRHAAFQWNIKAKYVLFFGDASYDYRSILKNDRSFVPTYETPQSNDKIRTYSNEDFFSYIDSNSTASVGIAHGRLTPRSIDDARFIVDRIIHYESNTSLGTWKNRITIVADDIYATPDDPNDPNHTGQAEVLASIYTPKDFDVKRIFLEEYPLVFTSSGRRKPDARRAILDQVNNGTLILNYIGHGNPKVWAHESVLTQDDVRNALTNSDRLTFIVAATCDWGRFDEAGESSSAEDVVFNAKGGAIGVLSATRAVYSHSNALTNQYFYSYLFSEKPAMRLGDAYLLTKNVLTDIENKQKYFLLGDPTLRLAVPGGTIVIDSLMNSLSVTTDTIKALEKITLTATVRDGTNAVSTSYNGTALLTIYDSEKTKSITTIPGFGYNENGAIIYKGESSIMNGVMKATFIVPKDIAYENKNGRISIYFSNAVSDGRGYTKNFTVGGTSEIAQPDSAGPEISIYFDDVRFRSGDVVNEQPTLIVGLKDSSGINSSTNSIGHRLEAWIDGSSKSIDLTEFYNGKVDSYQDGTAKYQFENLSQGSHSIKVRAWDVNNNSSTEEAFFIVASSGGLSIQQLYNFPNPVSTRTTFTFHHNQLTPIDVKIQVYSVAGRLIHTIESFGITDRFVKIKWNKRDADGD